LQRHWLQLGWQPLSQANCPGMLQAGAVECTNDMLQPVERYI